jgi:4-hydroxy-4-methyl-2-oxoglutarate aldolase
MADFPELLPKNIIERAQKLEVSQLCDGMKALKIPHYGCLTPDIHPIDPSFKMVGTAVTVETENGDNFPIHIATYSVPKEGYVMVIDGKGYKDTAYLGDKIMGACKAMGYKGIVIDGYTRDRSGNIALGFPVFSRGLNPAGPVKKNVGKINEVITCGGVEVHPGDLVCGDEDGVCVVPRDRIEEVLLEAEKKQAYENKRDKAIQDYIEKKRNGEKLPNLAPEWVLEMLNNKK